ncbi:c-type cytochrome [Inmirania thermothiophila]|nr:cytochrome c [Inmirania thermothiophila]
MSRTTRTWRAVLVLAGLVVLAGCGRQADDRPLLPPRGFVADPAKGEVAYRKYCAACHGEDLRGTASGPPFLSDIYRPGHHGDIAFYKAARDGVRAHHWRFGDMPPVKGVTAEEVGHIVAYVRRRQREAGIR